MKGPKRMPTIKYKNLNLRKSSLEIIETANNIIAEYAEEGFDLTLRQLYYQFVARGLIPNRDSEYKKLGGTINNARLTGLLDWDTIIDRTRTLRSNSHWSSPRDIIEACAASFRLDTRHTQDVYFEAWVEKDALIGVLESVCTDLDIPYFSCRGYVSQSAMWRAARRITQSTRDSAVVLHLGDHDPSGIDMTRDIQDRLNLFGCHARVDRIALNMDQVEEHQPPPNPAKITDSRFGAYVDEYGEESWELDALDPRTITGLIRDAVDALTDTEARTLLLKQQEDNRKELTEVADQWEDVIDRLE